VALCNSAGFAGGLGGRTLKVQTPKMASGIPMSRLGLAHNKGIQRVLAVLHIGMACCLDLLTLLFSIQFSLTISIPSSPVASHVTMVATLYKPPCPLPPASSSSAVAQQGCLPPMPSLSTPIVSLSSCMNVLPIQEVWLHRPQSIDTNTEPST